MKTKFKTFDPYTEQVFNRYYRYSSDELLNKWLEENPEVELVSWQTTPTGNAKEVSITIQYRVLED